MIRKNIRTSLTLVALPWVVYMLDLVIPADLRRFGLVPRSTEGLRGILFAPLLHGDFAHLVANSGALLMLLVVSLSFSRKLTGIAVLIVWLLGGALVWLFGRGDAIHIGSSGIIFGLIGFDIFSGIFRREWRALLVSLAVLALYGWAVLSLLVTVPGVSWTGHLFGFLAGILAAWWTRNQKATEKRRH